MLGVTWVTNRKPLRLDIFQKAQKIPCISFNSNFYYSSVFKKGGTVLLCANTTDWNPDWNIKNTFITVGSRRTLKSETYSSASEYCCLLLGTFRQKSDFSSASHGTLDFQLFLLSPLSLFQRTPCPCHIPLLQIPSALLTQPSSAVPSTGIPVTKIIPPIIKTGQHTKQLAKINRKLYKLPFLPKVSALMIRGHIQSKKYKK